jgi:EAL domain-containing protein (putative c-di-GMP-specific phosphodiesterase class I)
MLNLATDIRIIATVAASAAGSMSAWKNRFLVRNAKCRYEPIVSLSEGEIVGAELLCRASPWPRNHREWRRWYALIVNEMLETDGHGWMAINLDGAQATDRKIMKTIGKLDNRHVIEWTERHDGAEAAAVAASLRALRENTGVAIAIDDAGTGVDAMQRILLAQPQFVKIDGKIIQDACRKQCAISKAAILSLISISRAAGAKTIAEWIETPEDWDACREMGLDYGQGYFIEGAEDRQRHWLTKASIKKTTGRHHGQP